MKKIPFTLENKLDFVHFDEMWLKTISWFDL